MTENQLPRPPVHLRRAREAHRPGTWPDGVVRHHPGAHQRVRRSHKRSSVDSCRPGTSRIEPARQHDRARTLQPLAGPPVLLPTHPLRRLRPQPQLRLRQGSLPRSRSRGIPGPHARNRRVRGAVARRNPSEDEPGGRARGFRQARRGRRIRRSRRRKELNRKELNRDWDARPLEHRCSRGGPPRQRRSGNFRAFAHRSVTVATI